VKPAPFSVEDILTHPRFPDVRRVHIDGFIAIFGDSRFTPDMVADWGRLMSNALLVGLHAAYEPSDRATWPTTAAMRRLANGGGMASPRHVDEICARLRRTGYIESIPSPVDGRLRLLRPTERMIVQDRAFIAELMRPLSVIDPDGRYDLAAKLDPEFHAAFRKAWMASLPRTTSIIVQNRPIAMFWTRHAGYLALLLVARESIRAAGEERSPMTFSTIAKTLNVSRTHVRAIFTDAEANGFVKLGGRGGHEVTIMPPLRQAHDRWIAQMGAGYDALTLQALATLERPDRMARP
jgi:DNA-binding IscR family transcriptional regulator